MFIFFPFTFIQVPLEKITSIISDSIYKIFAQAWDRKRRRGSLALFPANEDGIVQATGVQSRGPLPTRRQLLRGFSLCTPGGWPVSSANEVLVTTSPAFSS